MFPTIYLCMFTNVYPFKLVFNTYAYTCLPMFTTVYSCMFTYVEHFQRIHGRVTLNFKINRFSFLRSKVSRSKLSSDK